MLYMFRVSYTPMIQKISYKYHTYESNYGFIHLTEPPRWRSVLLRVTSQAPQHLTHNAARRVCAD